MYMYSKSHFASHLLSQLWLRSHFNILIHWSIVCPYMCVITCGRCYYPLVKTFLSKQNSLHTNLPTYSSNNGLHTCMLCVLRNLQNKVISYLKQMKYFFSFSIVGEIRRYYQRPFSGIHCSSHSTVLFL